MRSLLVFSVVLNSLTALAATPPPAAELRGMTLPEALAYAKEHQPSLLAARQRIAAAQAAAQVPRAQWLPQVYGTAQLLAGSSNNSTAQYLGSPGVDLPRIGGTPRVPTVDISMAPAASTVLGVGVRQEVYDFGRVAALSAAADALTHVSEQQAGIAQLDVVLAVTNGYYAVQAARSVLKAATDAVTRATVNRDQAQAEVQQGLRRPIDLTRAEADLARYDVARVQAQGGVDSAQTVFAAVVGVPDERLDVSGEPPAPSALPALDSAIQTAMTHAPDVLAATASVEAQHAQIAATASQLKPDLSLDASVSGRGGGAATQVSGSTTGPKFETMTGDGFLPYVPNYDVGVVLTLPILDFTVRREIERDQQIENVRKEELANTRLQVTSAVQQAHVAAQVADASIVALDHSYQAAVANAKQAEALFKAGLSTALELADAEYLRSDAEIQLAVGRFQQMQARARLARVLGEGL